MRGSRAALGFALVAGLAGLSRGEEDVPPYEVPTGSVAQPLAGALAETARTAVATVLDPRAPEDAEEAARVLAGLGPSSLPQVVEAMRRAPWYARATLVGAVAEMDTSSVTPLLAAACGDPSFAVREAAVLGLGKTGDARCRAALAARAGEAEPVWRVRAAVATALRRACLRGAIDRGAAETSLLRLLDDSDADVRRAALKESAPLALPGALSRILAVFTDPTTPAADRRPALSALRAYHASSPELLDALRKGLLAGEDPEEAVLAGRTLLELRGADALKDDAVASAIVRQIRDSEGFAMRDALARLGRSASPWIAAETLRIAARIASGRETHDDTAFDDLLETLLQVDAPAGEALIRDVLFGTDADQFDRATRLAVLRKVEFVYAPRLRDELRALFDSKAGADVRPEALRAIVASGGDDLARFLDAAVGHPRRDVRMAAMELLGRRPDLPAGDHLRDFAREAADPVERHAALDTLSRRKSEVALAAQIAVKLLDDPRVEIRSQAIGVLSASRSPEHLDALVRRLSVEDGSDAPRTARDDAPESSPRTPPAVTRSDRERSLHANARRLRHALLQAIRVSGGERARGVLLTAARSEQDPAVRSVAARGLRGLALDADAATLLSIEAAETDADVRGDLLRTIAGLRAPPARECFEALIRAPRTRDQALTILAEPEAVVVPSGLVEGVEGREWTEDERTAALEILSRAGRALPPSLLGEVVVGSRTLDLCGEAARVLASSSDPLAAQELLRLLGVVTDPERLSVVVAAAGTRRLSEAEPTFLALFERTRDAAFAATSADDPAIGLYRRVAEALAESGSEAAGGALATHLCDPRLARAAARLHVLAGGPFEPEEAAPIALARTLAASFARRDDPTCRRLLAQRLDAMSRTGADLALPEQYLDGLGRMLRDPLAYRLPARPRPGAASLLFRLALRAAPRLSPIDVHALSAVADECVEERRFRAAADTVAARRALLDVEDAARTREERVLEDCAANAYVALALATEGHRADGLALARKLREADPTAGEPAYRQGWCLARLGAPYDESLASLLHAAARDDRDPRVHFQIAWVTEQSAGPDAALPYYDEAFRLDRKRAEDRRGDTRAAWSGTPHENAAYAYWYARALRSAGRDDDAVKFLVAAVSLDDRLCREALSDSAFFAWEPLDAALETGLVSVGRNR